MVDLHCDILYKLAEDGGSLMSNQYQFDIDRAKKAGLNLQFLALFTNVEAEAGGKAIERQMDIFFQAVENNPKLKLIKRYQDIVENIRQDSFSCLLHLENGAVLQESTEELQRLYNKGLRSLGLTWNYRNGLADGVNEENDQGITKAGRNMIKAMSEMDMVLDLAHISEKSFFQALDLYTKPVLVTHANAYGIYPHKRNLKDQQLKKLAEHEGVIGVTLVADFIADFNNKLVDIDKLMDHFVYIADMIGTEYIALGSDFDGADNMVMAGVEQYEGWEPLFLRRGFSKRELDMITQNNALRILREII
ncbi:MAG: membrane dipeptidase [Syntrophomonadaceae bacterium]|jgi:membrane dipeptidase|nr:membrane dipeptidase [Syntrophomonadaceae bacterium]